MWTGGGVKVRGYLLPCRGSYSKAQGTIGRLMYFRPMNSRLVFPLSFDIYTCGKVLESLDLFLL